MVKNCASRWTFHSSRIMLCEWCEEPEEKKKIFWPGYTVGPCLLRFTYLQIFQWNMTVFYENPPKNMQLRKLKYLGTILLDMPMAGICKATNLGVAFIFLAAHWLYPPRAEIRKKNILIIYAVVPEWFKLWALIHINTYLVFELQQKRSWRES